MKTHLILAALVSLCGIAHGAVISYIAFLEGPSEAPPVASPGIGTATVTYDLDAKTLAFGVSFSGLLGTTTAAHIHAPTAVPGAGTVGVAVAPPSLAEFPIGVTAGLFVHVYDLTLPDTYGAAFLTAGGGTSAGAEALLASALADGKAYFNIHSTAFPGGEIRGFFSPVPEPASAGFLGAGLLGWLALGRRRVEGVA